MATRKVSIVVGTSLVLWAASASAADWPRFRGPNGTGISNDKNVPVLWTDKEVLWKIAIPGMGHSSPVVWGKHVFVQTCPKDNERVLLCLDVSDGKILWSQSAPGSSAHTHKRNTLASSTPATDGERVYALFWDGVNVALHAYDFQGQLVWKKNLGSFTSQHGAGASPIVHEDKVFLNFDQDKFKDDKEKQSNFPGRPSTLFAFDARTGKDAWQAARPGFRTCYSTPFVLEKQGEAVELIVASTAGITGYEPKTGAEIWNWTWSFSGMPLRTVASPVYSQGLIFANGGDGSGERHMVAVKKGQKGDVSKTNLAWENKKVLPYVPCLLTWGDHVYFVNDLGVAGCVAAKTGTVVWTERLGGATAASPILIDGKIYSVSEEGEVYVFPAEPTFKLLAKNALGEGVIATPAVADGRLFIRGKAHLFCIGKPAEK